MRVRDLSALAVAALLLLVFGGCSDNSPTPTAVPASSTALPTPTPIIEPPGTEAELARLGGVTLIEVASTGAHDLYRGTERSATPLWFEPDGSVWLSVSHFEDGATSYLYQRFDLDGRVIEERTGREARPDRAPVDRPTCNVPPAALAVAIPDAPFGIRASATSPDCSKVVLVANIEDPNIVGGRQALWLLDVPTASLTLLTDQARSCGGCDLAASGGRSPSGRYVL